MFFFQLILIAPFLIYWDIFCNSRKWKYVWHIVTVLFLCYCSSLFIRYTNVLPVYGGGKYIFGGTYIILYYLGIILATSNVFNRLKKHRIFLLICSTLCWIFWWLMCSYGRLPFDEWLKPYYGDGFNPPSIEFMFFSIITLFMLYSIFSLLEERTQIIAQKIICICSLLGRYTLYIYMYHLLVKDVLITYFPFVYINKWILRVCVLTLMIVFPVFVICLIRKGIECYRFFVDKN